MGYVSLAEDQMDRLAESLWEMSKSGERVLQEARDHGYDNFARSLSQLIAQAMTIKTDLESNLGLATDPALELANEMRVVRTDRDVLRKQHIAMTEQRKAEHVQHATAVKKLSHMVEVKEHHRRQALRAVQELEGALNTTASKDERFRDKLRQIGCAKLLKEATKYLA